MKYFTPQWVEEADWLALPYDVAAEREQAVIDGYWKHAAGLLPSMPPELHQLVQGSVSLHDGLVLNARLSDPWEELRLLLNCGNEQDGFFDLDLKYQALRPPGPTPALLEELVSSKAQARYDEFDRTDEGHLVHRILFWIGRDVPAGPYRELEMVFGTLRMTQTRARRD